MGREADRVGAVDHPVVVGQRNRQHQPGRQPGADVDRPADRARDAEDPDLRRVDDRREGGAADAAETRDREGGALDVGGPQLALPGTAADLGQLPGQFVDALAIHVAHDGNNQAVRRVHRDPQVDVALQDQRFPVRGERRVHLRELGQRRRDRLHQEGQQGEPNAAFARLLEVSPAKRLQFRDVGLVVLGDVRHVEPAPMEACRRQFADAAQGLGLDRAELREVDLRDRRNAGARSPRPAAGHHLLHEALDVLAQNPPLGAGAGNPPQVDAQHAREPPHRGAGVGRGRAGGRGRGGGRRRAASATRPAGGLSGGCRCGRR